MKRALIIVGIVLAILVIVPVVGLIGYGIQIRRTLDSNRTFLLKEVNHQAVASACLDLLTRPEYQPLIGQSPSGDDPRLPAAIRAVKPFWLSVSSNDVLIMKTGGHYHMGYIFRASTSVSNQYDLVFREEKDLDHDIPLYSVHRQ